MVCGGSNEGERDGSDHGELHVQVVGCKDCLDDNLRRDAETRNVKLDEQTETVRDGEGGREKSTTKRLFVGLDPHAHPNV